MQTKKMSLTKICFNHEQEHISQVFFIQVSVFKTVCLLLNIVSLAICLKLISFELREFWKLAYQTYFNQAVKVGNTKQ